MFITKHFLFVQGVTNDSALDYRPSGLGLRPGQLPKVDLGEGPRGPYFGQKKKKSQRGENPARQVNQNHPPPPTHTHLAGFTALILCKTFYSPPRCTKDIWVHGYISVNNMQQKGGGGRGFI